MKGFTSRMSQQYSPSVSPVVGPGQAFHAINNKRRQLLQIDNENAKLYYKLRNK